MQMETLQSVLRRDGYILAGKKIVLVELWFLF